MKALLDIQGWRKIDEIPDYSDFRGWVRIAISPPFDILFRPTDKAINTNITTVELYYEGMVNNMPFFKARV